VTGLNATDPALVVIDTIGHDPKVNSADPGNGFEVGAYTRTLFSST
jgi:hypothetical protein